MYEDLKTHFGLDSSFVSLIEIVFIFCYLLVNMSFLKNATSRIRYGPIVQSGNFEDYQPEYRRTVENMENVDVKAQGWYNALPEIGTLFSNPEFKIASERRENLTGEDAWDFANSVLEESSPVNYEQDEEFIEEIPFYFEHRKRNDKNRIELNASARTFLGSRWAYRVTFEGEDQSRY